MRTERLRLTLAIVAILAITTMTLAAMLSAPQCHADPIDTRNHDAAVFCRDLDRDSSIAGVVEALRKPLLQGIDRQVIADTAGYALLYICPEYQDEVHAAAEAINPEKVLIA